MAVLVVNSGSSSLKLAVFDDSLAQIASGMVGEIGGASRLTFAGRSQDVRLADHAAAIEALLQAAELAGHPFSAVRMAAHRVVHGGMALTRTQRISPAVLAAIEAAVPLAPLHNPANLAPIRALTARAPDLPQFAAFDTAFHATNPAVARRYAIPQALHDQGLCRFGFHGISFAALVRKVKEITGDSAPDRLLALHLGNGVSLCAIRGGQSVATTMGYSPLEGLTMGTRAGTIDGNAVLRLADQFGIGEAGRILNRESGLLALGGTNDMRALHASGTPEARFAIDHFCYWAVRHAGSMIAAMGGLDAVAFTGGIGENDPLVRAEILKGLAFAGAEVDPEANRAGTTSIHKSTSPVAIWIVPAEEERQIAIEAMTLWASEPQDEPAAD